MYKKISLVITTIFFFSVSVQAQLVNERGVVLRVGDRLPAQFWNFTHSILSDGKVVSSDLSTYKNKVLILDFWATWCGPCIKNFPMEDSLEHAFGGKLKILAVNPIINGDSLSRVKAVMLEKGLGLSTIVSDTLLFHIFRHSVLPHYVWIVNGTWLSSTGGDFLTRENIDVVLRRWEQMEKIRKRKEKP